MFFKAPCAQKIYDCDEDAYVAMIERYSRLLWKIAVGIFGVYGNTQDVEDCIAEVFFRLWKNPQGYDPKRGSIKNYLVLLTKSCAIDMLRKKSRYNETVLQESATQDRDHTEAQVVENEAMQSLQNALDKLKPVDKEIVTRRFFQEQKPAEIAEIMNIPVRQVENRLYRAKIKLKNSIR